MGAQQLGGVLPRSSCLLLDAWRAKGPISQFFSVFKILDFIATKMYSRTFSAKKTTRIYPQQLTKLLKLLRHLLLHKADFKSLLKCVSVMCKFTCCYWVLRHFLVLFLNFRKKNKTYKIGLGVCVCMCVCVSVYNFGPPLSISKPVIRLIRNFGYMQYRTGTVQSH